jgi:hypothetical protein
MECRYRSRAFVSAWERGRADGRRGVPYDQMRDLAEQHRYRGAYSRGFALGKTEEVLGRPVADEVR